MWYIFISNVVIRFPPDSLASGKTVRLSRIPCSPYWIWPKPGHWAGTGTDHGERQRSAIVRPSTRAIFQRRWLKIIRSKYILRYGLIFKILTEQGTHVTIAGNVPGQLLEVGEVEENIKAHQRQAFDTSRCKPKWYQINDDNNYMEDNCFFNLKR